MGILAALGTIRRPSAFARELGLSKQAIHYRWLTGGLRLRAWNFSPNGALRKQVRFADPGRFAEALADFEFGSRFPARVVVRAAGLSWNTGKLLLGELIDLDLFVKRAALEEWLAARAVARPPRTSWKRWDPLSGVSPLTFEPSGAPAAERHRTSTPIARAG